MSASKPLVIPVDCERILLVDGYPVNVYVPLEHPMNSLDEEESSLHKRLVAEEIREFRCMDMMLLRPANAPLSVIL